MRTLRVCLHMGLRAQENPLFTIVLAKAQHLKARHLGNAQCSTATHMPSLSTLELRTLSVGCDLDLDALAELDSACDAVLLDAS